MKKIIYAIIIVWAALSVGCNYLDIVPDDTPALKDAFKNELTAENFVFSCYSFMPRYGDVKLNKSLFTNEFTATQHWGAQWFEFMSFQMGLVSSSNPVDDLWQRMYQGIRQCYTYLENIGQAVPVAVSQAEFDRMKKQWNGEVNFLIAYYHYVLLKHYGPVAIIDRLIGVNDTGDELFYPRLPFDECVVEIAEMFDKAATDLPEQPATKSQYGRPTKLIAQCMKAEMYLFAASPLYNGNSEYYSDFKGYDGTLLINQTEDKDKWKKAMDENLAAIEMAEQLGFGLYEYSASVTGMNDFEKTVATQRYKMVDRWENNAELIWGYTGFKDDGITNSYYDFCVPIGFKIGNPLGSVGPTLKPVEIFYSENGIPCEDDPTYDWAGRMTIAPGDVTIKLHRNREPRFYAAIGFDRGEYEINGGHVELRLRKDETNGVPAITTGHLYGGYAVKKGIHPDIAAQGNTWSIIPYHFPLMRLGELYLNYAEAYAEYHGKLDGDAKEYFNLIRDQAGIDRIDVAFPGVADGPIDPLRKVIHRERMIEFVFEGHWYFDLRRWKEAENFFASDRAGMWGLNTMGATAEQFYTRKRLSHSIVFDRKHHLYPIKQEYIDINYKLVQNPGW